MNILLVSMVVAALAQPVADRPEFGVGDRWEYTIKRADGTTQPWWREVIGFNADGQVRAKSNQGNVLLYDRDFNLIGVEGQRAGRVLGSVRYPLKVGDRWDISRNWDNPDITDTGSASVAAYEKVGVPAGEFDCYRVEADSSFTRRLYSERRKTTRWYCPSLKFIAKEIATTTVFDPSNPASNATRTETSELVSFVRGR
jgi:hypothetical protein